MYIVPNTPCQHIVKGPLLALGIKLSRGIADWMEGKGEQGVQAVLGHFVLVVCTYKAGERPNWRGWSYSTIFMLHLVAIWALRKEALGKWKNNQGARKGAVFLGISGC